MKHNLQLLVLFCLLTPQWCDFNLYAAAHSGQLPVKRISLRIEGETSLLNSRYVVVAADNRLSNEKGVTLLKDAEEAIDGEREEADLTFALDLPEGRYQLSTYAFTDSLGAEMMKAATSKYESLYMRLQIDNERPAKRVVYVPWDARRQVSGVFSFMGGQQELKLWLPKGVRLDYITLETYQPPRVPDAVQDYLPVALPPSSRPRLWVNEQSLEQVKASLDKGENKEYWDELQRRALAPFKKELEEQDVITYDEALERTTKYKAFYFLMTGDQEIGREAVDLTVDYLSRVEFGNLLDITREIGRAIYSASLVYDWCHALMSSDERNLLYHHLMRLAEEMEMGWPPFHQSVLTGHGGEAQVSRDLLAMSIAIYDENPEPYRYTSYRMLQELAPMRAWQYQSPRHNQGVSYGAYRSQFDMHAAWLLYRMSGRELFDPNLKRLPYYWLYMRLPNGEMLRDGDGFSGGKPGEFNYWKQPDAFFLFYTYANDPLLKGEFMRQGGRISDPVLFLLLNDPALKAEQSLASLPLTLDFGPVLGSMIARTGWNIGMESDDVVAEIKGGGYHFGNHQQSDAGAIQLFYRGLQVADLGLYGFYGTPYDMNFNKRSISHSMMLVVDPDEKFGNLPSNDGGTRFNQRHPESPQVAMGDPWFHNGTVLSSDQGPAYHKPIYSYFSVDLTSAYSNKIETYRRQFCFINLENDTIPAIVVLLDKMRTTNHSFQKYWQVNTLLHPTLKGNGIILHSNMDGRKGATHLQLFLPEKENISVELFSGEEANSSFGTRYEVPARAAQHAYPEASGHRLMVSPKKPVKNDHFLAMFQVTDGDHSPIDVEYTENESHYQLSFRNYLLSLNKSEEMIGEAFSLVVPRENMIAVKVMIMGLKPGSWSIRDVRGQIRFQAEVIQGKNSIYFHAPVGAYSITPDFIAH